MVARSGARVADTSYGWPIFPNGAGTIGTDDGGWILVTNSESLALVGGGTSAIRFSPTGDIADAYRILGGTTANCAGGMRPWGTWLSCEERPTGQVWECDPFQPSQGEARPALGVFQHEAASVDPDGSVQWLTVPDPSSTDPATRCQLPEATVFGGGEGLWYHEGVVYFTTKVDHRVWALDATTNALSVLWEGVPGDPVAEP